MRTKLNVLITRPDERLADAKSVLDTGRFRLLPCPTVSLINTSRTPYLDKIFAEVDEFDFVVFTSQQTVTAAMAYLNALGMEQDVLNSSCVCAVGPVTARALAGHNVNTAVVPNEYTAQALVALFPPMRTYSPRVLFLKGDKASGLIQEELSRKGYQVTSVVMYENKANCELPPEAAKVLDAGCAACVAFTSPSSVFALKNILGDTIFLNALKDSVIGAIGPVTSAACITTGLTVAVQPERYTLRDLATAIVGHFATGKVIGQ